MLEVERKSLYDRLYDPSDHPILVSPLAGWTDLPYRKVLHRCGSRHLFVPFISAHALEKEENREKYREEVSAEKGPVQIFGNNPEICARAASMLEDAGA